MSEGAVSYRDAMMMTQAERRALFFAIGEAKGGVIDWERGTIDWPEAEADD
jgi:hypothetical protein